MSKIFIDFSESEGKYKLPVKVSPRACYNKTIVLI
jgi:hypothetical protein